MERANVVKVTVRLGEPFWREVGEHDVELALPDGARVAQALDALTRRYPRLARMVETGEASWTAFLDDDPTDPDRPLPDGATLHLLWPLSGG